MLLNKSHFSCRSRRGSPKGHCPTSVDAPKAIQPTTEQATGEHGAVQPGLPRCTWNAATYTASQHLCEGPGALLPRHGHPSSLLAADPGPNCPGILIPPLEPLRRGSLLYDLVVVAKRRLTTTRRWREANHIPLRDLSTPTCCPESSPS